MQNMPCLSSMFRSSCDYILFYASKTKKSKNDKLYCSLKMFFSYFFPTIYFLLLHTCPQGWTLQCLYNKTGNASPLLLLLTLDDKTGMR